MHLPQSLSRMPESFPGGSLQVCSLFLGREPHMHHSLFWFPWWDVQ